MFDQMRADPKVELVGQETWADGRTVYVLRSHLSQAKTREPLPAVLTTYFDVNTYQFYGGKQVVTKDGREILVNEKLVTIDEILPIGTIVHWDLSDLKGILLIDDPTGIHHDDSAQD